MKIYNTSTRKKEEFKPIENNLVKVYTCGPTVYNYAHIGNLRTYIFEDILKRVLLFNGFKVKHVMNITDVGHLTSDADTGEDKLDVGARREKKTPLQIAEFYTKAFQNDIKLLNILPPDIWCKATEHVKDQIEWIKKLVKKGYTYETDEVLYFDSAKFKNYGKLAGLDAITSKVSRVEPDPNKKNPADFALWFKLVGKHKNHIMHWPSPWGEGFPGWHIECSTMSTKYLGEHFDIHCGGVDHIPIHHTNEIAQTEAVTGKKWVNFWVHGEFLVLEKTKMAKSGENFITLQTLIDKGYNPLDYRYFCLNAHYRSPLSFNWENLDSAKDSFNKLKERLIEIKKNLNTHKTENYEKYKKEFLDAINNDLGMPEAMAVVWAVVKDSKLGNKEKYELLLEFDKILGLDIDKIKKEKIGLPKEIMDLIIKREGYRKRGDFEAADKIRKGLKEKGYLIEDTPQGPRWKKVK